MKESSDNYSRASSLTDGDFYISKAPSVVARLMGLDSLSISNILEPNSTPLSDCRSSTTSSRYKSKDLEYFQDFTEPKYQKAVQRPIKKFQTEVLPPKSAKSVPITRRKLLSAVKSSNFIPHKDAAAHIMEAAAGIIEPRKKTNLPLASSSSVPLKVRDLNEKVQTAKKPPESEFVDSGNKGKPISLALQAKANVRKRTLVSQKETNESSTNKVLTSQSQKNKKPSTRKCTNVLRQNNQKQNCAVDRKKSSPLKPSLRGGKKSLSSDFSSFASQRNSSKLVGPSKVSSSKPTPEVRDDKRRLSERVTRNKKRSFDGNYHSENNRDARDSVMKGKNGKVVDSGAVVTDVVVSFTFTAPMTTRQGAGSVGPADQLAKNCKMFSADSPSKRIMLDSGHNNVRGGDISRKLSPTSTVPKSRETTLTSPPYCNKPRSQELDYVNELLRNIEPMFKDYVLGKTSTIIKPRLFDQLESRKACGNITRLLNSRLVFDCVNECLDGRCRRYAKGGYGLWAKGLFVVKRKDILAEDVYRVISGWSAMGHLMVDEIVDDDMSSENGTWRLDYDVGVFEVGMQIEARVLNALIDDVVDDILVL